MVHANSWWSSVFILTQRRYALAEECCHRQYNVYQIRISLHTHTRTRTHIHAAGTPCLLQHFDNRTVNDEQKQCPFLDFAVIKSYHSVCRVGITETSIIRVTRWMISGRIRLYGLVNRMVLKGREWISTTMAQIFHKWNYTSGRNGT